MKTTVLMVGTCGLAESAVRKTVHALGLELMFVHSEDDATIALQSVFIDILIVDLDVATLNGLDFLRIAETRHTLRAIAVSASADPQEAEDAHAAGFDILLRRPVTIPMLRESVHRLATLCHA